MKLPTKVVMPDRPTKPSPEIAAGSIKLQNGFSLIELLVVITIFGIMMTGIFDAYLSQMTLNSREHRIAEAEIELEVAKQIIEEDLQVAGFGLAEDYGATGFDPRPFKVTNSNSAPDELLIMGTPLGLDYVASRAWSYMTASTPTFRAWGDAREDLEIDDRVIIISPDTKQLLSETVGGSEEWLFEYNGDGLPLTTIPSGAAYSNHDVGTILYGLYPDDGSANDASANPYYTSRYYLGDVGDPKPASCAPGTRNLFRVESVTTETPPGNNNQPLLSCVLDFQVAVDLDMDENDFWESDNGGVTAAGLDLKDMNDFLKRIKVYLLVQNGRYDPDYTYPLATVRVGEDTTIGRAVTLTAAQRKYRWKMVTLNVTPRNAR